MYIAKVLKFEPLKNASSKSSQEFTSGLSWLMFHETIERERDLVLQSRISEIEMKLKEIQIGTERNKEDITKRNK